MCAFQRAETRAEKSALPCGREPARRMTNTPPLPGLCHGWDSPGMPRVCAPYSGYGPIPGTGRKTLLSNFRVSAVFSWRFIFSSARGLSVVLAVLVSIKVLELIQQ